MLPLSHSMQLSKAKKRLRSVDWQSFRAILKTAKELKSRISIESLWKSDSNVQEEVKQGTCQYKIAILNQFSCECSLLQTANWRTCHHIVWPLLNLWNISERTQLLAQVYIGKECVTTRIHSDRTYNDKLINHRPFQRDQMWYLGSKVSGSPCLCSGCLHPRYIQNNDLHMCVKDLLLLKQQSVVDTKLSFCLSAGSVNVISSSYNNIRPLGNKSVLLDPQLEIITAAEKEKVIAEKCNIDMDSLTVN